MNCPVCNSSCYHLFTRATFQDDECEAMKIEVYKSCLACGMRTGYYDTEDELNAIERRNPFKRADW